MATTLMTHEHPGRTVVLRFSSATSDEVAIFQAFGYASFCAQGFESLVIRNLQYSLVLKHAFKSPQEMDASAAKHGVMPMGQVFAILSPLLKDEGLRRRIQHAIFTRNDLSHHFFRTRKSGAFMSTGEIKAAIQWCNDASAEFAAVSAELDTRCHELAAQVARDPESYVPGLARATP